MAVTAWSTMPDSGRLRRTRSPLPDRQLRDHVRYSDVVSQARSYARKKLVMLHRGPVTRLKKRLIEERKDSLKEGLRYVRVHVMDVVEMRMLVLKDVDLSDADSVQLLFTNAEHENVPCNVQKHV